MSTVDQMPWLPPAPVDFQAQLKTARTAGFSELAALAQTNLNPNQLTALSMALVKASATEDGPNCIRLGILSNATIGLTGAMVPAASARYNLVCRTAAVEYDQLVGAALGHNATLASFAPHVVLLALDHEGLPWGPVLPGADDAAAVAEPLRYLQQLRDGIRQSYDCPVILQTIAMPATSLFGNFERRVSGTRRRAVARLNDEIVAMAHRGGDFLLDVADLASRVGLDRWYDLGQWYQNKLPFALSNAPIYADHVARLLAAIRGKSKKCLVLDLDNTVWGGVIGDDGLAGIKLSNGDPVGEAHLAIQRHALDLKSRGIILAVCSKNDIENARQPFREHPDMLLKDSDIAVFQANWIDKATNLEAIAKALNIGIDALVLLDDNPAERAQVRAALPMVGIPELTDDPSDFVWLLSSAGYFETVSFSEEDRLRADSYAADAQRVAVMQQARNLGEYLASLEMEISFKPFDQINRPRIAQLINKSNQFNLTTRRYTEAEVEQMEGDRSIYTLQVRLKDRFSDAGMIGVIIARPITHEGLAAWDIDSWLMSCRVLGRKVEEAMLAETVRSAKMTGIAKLIGRYVPTNKNGMVQEHYAKLGFTHIEGTSDGPSAWSLDLDSYEAPELPMRIA